MLRLLITAAIVVFVARDVGAADEAAKERFQAALKQISPQVVPEAERGQLRTMLSRSLRERIGAANEASSAAWSKIETREDWERFRQDKLAALRTAIGPFSPRPAKPRTRITGRIQGDGFQIQN